MSRRVVLIPHPRTIRSEREYKPAPWIDLVGDGCPWATVEQMAEDLEEVAAWMNRTLPPQFLEGVAGRAGMAAAVLSTGSQP